LPSQPKKKKRKLKKIPQASPSLQANPRAASHELTTAFTPTRSRLSLSSILARGTTAAHGLNGVGFVLV